ncbi:unnamed protein product [Pseudo-nitzschia multistriata]|uniref:Leucine-rich repeat-containing N-terminal plant-type domain-containing protein n=1 Tax=Pseudo-nitzschia multistriata TaxID=183589 RepID=A0A448YZI5_9STRA|nr:unnamed protein product [Pseudo-nitzschia multistriata]
MRIFMIATTTAVWTIAILTASNSAFAENLRASTRRNPTIANGGILSGNGNTAATLNDKTNKNNDDEEEPKERTNGDISPPAFDIDGEEKGFYDGLLLEQLSSFDETLPPSNSPQPTMPIIKVTKPPGNLPTIPPSAAPTTILTTDPPTVPPTGTPKMSPTLRPTTESPSSSPTNPPTRSATGSPTETPSKEPTKTPTREPTEEPTEDPSQEPSSVVSEGPTSGPTVSVTTASPTEMPTIGSSGPTGLPTTGTLAPTAAAPSTPSPTLAPVITTIPTPSPSLSNPGPTSSLSSASPSVSTTQKCNLSQEGRSALINIFLRVVSNPAEVDTPGSPQMLALKWMIDGDPMQLCPQDKHLIQRYVMAVFYFSTRGDRWIQCSAPPPEAANDAESEAEDEQNANALCTIEVDGVDSNSHAWLTSGTECGWGGVGCNEEGFVVRIEMEQNGVGGTLAHELSRLQNLRNLVLEEGILTGTIPTELGEIRSLEQIDLNFNLLQGPIPEELYMLSNLRQLDLNDNELTGSISTSISDLGKLSFFQIENNLFSGTVPTQMGELLALEVATMDNNRLSGTVPCGAMEPLPELQVLTVDCLGAPNRPSPPLVVCECCTQCF